MRKYPVRWSGAIGAHCIDDATYEDIPKGSEVVLCSDMERTMGEMRDILRDAPTSQSADFAIRYRIWTLQAIAALAKVDALLAPKQAEEPHGQQ
jgi:hypothetical protein